jgi:hypothetical protein
METLEPKRNRPERDKSYQQNPVTPITERVLIHVCNGNDKGHRIREAKTHPI